ncbi:phosphatidate cytidylyltransferase [Allorhizobium sp. BGMRC 0089]|uniref:phosphatidate cytidylyltransferase n=1 Tax=Allorhizobium sonneratiae TaxID=2934936 RepID=UPI0020345ED7|nr:phosphatidate cytidylyltransferase [Allorhizobium sonneratiae]MCM2293625.1 phosphatidate cytidylyltransferase [Allorhizobium sonneratiae]
MSKELQLRTLSSIVMLIVVLIATFMGGMAFRLLSVVIGVAVYLEWSEITQKDNSTLRAKTVGWMVIVVLAFNLVLGDSSFSLPILGGCGLTLILLALLRKLNWWLPGGVFYAGLCMVSLTSIRGDDALGFVAMLFVFVIVWSTDILAYFIGRAIGGPKLAPRISPGKTWSGAIAGTIAGIAGGSIVAFGFFSSVGWWIPLLSLVLSVFSQMGDLFESFIKRRFGVKDSGRLIPGHGGVMDRVDGLLAASAAAFIIACFMAAGAAPDMDSLGRLFFGLGG